MLSISAARSHPGPGDPGFDEWLEDEHARQMNILLALPSTPEQMKAAAEFDEQMKILLRTTTTTTTPARDGNPARDGQQQSPARGKSLTLTILMRNCELSSTIIGGICDPRPKYET